MQSVETLRNLFAAIAGSLWRGIDFVGGLLATTVEDFDVNEDREAYERVWLREPFF